MMMFLALLRDPRAEAATRIRERRADGACDDDTCVPPGPLLCPDSEIKITSAERRLWIAAARSAG
jgi:hypothetical protein